MSRATPIIVFAGLLATYQTPMRALILSDIHANLEALTAVLEHAEALTPPHHVLWNLGDTVGYGGSPNQVIERIRPHLRSHRPRQS